MSRVWNTGTPLLAGVVCGIALVVACDSGPSKTEAQTSVTCTVPPVTVQPVTCSVPPATVTCTVPPVACSTSGQGRSSVAGTWTLAGICIGRLHLTGTDSTLSGAWNCNVPSGGGPSSGTVSGEYSGGRLRLHFVVTLQGTNSNAPKDSIFLVDATVAGDGASATGTVQGSSPASSASFSMALQ